MPGVRVLEHDERITRWSFYRYVLAIEPDAFAGRTNQAVCDALEAEGVGAWTGYEPMSRYDLFQPSLSRLPVAVEFADRLDPARMSFPVAEAAGLRESVYVDENVFRDGEQRGRPTRSRRSRRSRRTPTSCRTADHAGPAGQRGEEPRQPLGVRRRAAHPGAGARRRSRPTSGFAISACQRHRPGPP